MDTKERWMEELAKMRQRAERAESELAERDKLCVWTLDDVNWYMAECGEDFDIKQGAFCPNCGHRIEVAP